MDGEYVRAAEEGRPGAAPADGRANLCVKREAMDVNGKREYSAFIGELR